jgi:hypothetical protein
MIVTPRSFPAASAPACTDFQYECVVPLGITAIVKVAGAVELPPEEFCAASSFFPQALTIRKNEIETAAKTLERDHAFFTRVSLHQPTW